MMEERQAVQGKGSEQACKTSGKGVCGPHLSLVSCTDLSTIQASPRTQREEKLALDSPAKAPFPQYTALLKEVWVKSKQNGS